MPALAPQPNVPIAYLTDVEGQWTKVTSFTTDNPLVSLDDQERLVVAKGAVFVFGGDAIDRGPAGRRVVDTLLEAKLRQPDQVVLIAGNRDLNKLRLSRELQGHPPKRCPGDMRRKSPAELLQWIFENTMGARGAFEHRRIELSHEQARKNGGAVDDDRVAQSYIDDTAPDGALTRYLQHAQLVFRAGASIFVHGGIRDESLGYVPGENRAETPDAWIARLNGWYASMMQAYVDQRLDDDDQPIWTPLIAYQAPAPGMHGNPHSVVYGRTADLLNNAELPSRAVIGALEAVGVHRIVVGHTPNGDIPSILREDGFELVVADTSRGRVDEAPRFAVDDAHIDVRGTTVLDDGAHERVEFQLAIDDDTSPIGRRLKESGRLVKGSTANGDCVLFRYLEGFRAEQIKDRADRVRRADLVPPRPASALTSGEGTAIDDE